MIKRLFVIALLAYFFFLLEFILYDTLGAWGKPELLLLLVVFWGLYSGIRYSIAAAIFAGTLKDIFSTHPFGTYLFVLLVVAYFTTLVRRNFYQPGSPFSRWVVAFFVFIGTFCVEVILYGMRHEVRLAEVFFNIFLPALVTTMMVVTFVFHRLRDVAVRFKL